MQQQKSITVIANIRIISTFKWTLTQETKESRCNITKVVKINSVISSQTHKNKRYQFNLPIILLEIITFCCVCATSMKVKVEASASTSQIVKLVPSTHMNPLGTIYFMFSWGTWICIPWIIDTTFFDIMLLIVLDMSCQMQVLVM